METIQFIAERPCLFIALVGFFSAFIGSFLNVVIYRLPRMMEHDWSEECRSYLGLKPEPPTQKLGLHLPASHCPHCKKPIKPWHNIPILSYILLRGRCHACHGHIAIRYPLVEALTALSSMYVAAHFGFTLETFSALLFTWILIALTFIDLDCQLLPDELTLSLLWLGLFFSLFSLFAPSHDAIIGAMAGYLIFSIIQWSFKVVTGKVGLGQGDFKLLAAFGAYLGWQLLPFIVLFASFTGIIFTFIQMVVTKQFKSKPLPFGPYLAAAGWIALMWGQDILEFYMKTMV